MFVLPDTSIWISHLKQEDAHLSFLLKEGFVAVHPFIIGEMACGNLKNRREIISLLEALPGTPVVNQAELLHFIDKRELAGSGIGFIDAHLLAASELMKVFLWTLDKPLQRVAHKLDLSYLNKKEY